MLSYHRPARASRAAIPRAAPTECGLLPARPGPAIAAAGRPAPGAPDGRNAMTTRTHPDAEPLASPPGPLVAVAGPDGEADGLDARWAAYTGAAPAASLGRGWLEAVHPDDRGPLLRAWAEAAAAGRAFEVGLRLRRADGVDRPHLARWAPLLDASGASSRWVGVFEEVDDAPAVERLERAFRDRLAELRRSNSELERFASVAAHDLQEPLRKILAFGERLSARSGSLEERGREQLDRIVSAAGRMRGMIDGILAVARVAPPSRSAPVDAAEVAGEVLADLDDLIVRTGGRVELGPLPPVRADRVQLRQLLQNLVANALKFHPPGRGCTVRVSAREEPGDARRPPAWVLEVSDDGIGFDAAHAEKIFRPFERLNPRASYEGSGMGLAICRRIVDRHSGTIEATGEPGRGATFRVALPARTPSEPPKDPRR